MIGIKKFKQLGWPAFFFKIIGLTMADYIWTNIRCNNGTDGYNGISSDSNARAYKATCAHPASIFQNDRFITIRH